MFGRKHDKEADKNNRTPRHKQRRHVHREQKIWKTGDGKMHYECECGKKWTD